MIHGLDTGLLVAAEVTEHLDHGAARQLLAQLVETGDRIAIAPQVLAEFITCITPGTTISPEAKKGQP